MMNQMVDVGTFFTYWTPVWKNCMSITTGNKGKNMETKKEIFCSECKWLYEEPWGGIYCTHPDNLVTLEEKNWYARTRRQGYYRAPSIRNAKNDCPKFKPHFKTPNLSKKLKKR